MSHRVRLRPIMGFLGIALFSTANGPNIKEFFNNYHCSQDGTNLDPDINKTAEYWDQDQIKTFGIWHFVLKKNNCKTEKNTSL